MSNEIYEIIKKVKDDELSLQESIVLFNNDEIWNFTNSPGNISIFIFKKILSFLPVLKFKDYSNSKKVFEKFNIQLDGLKDDLSNIKYDSSKYIKEAFKILLKNIDIITSNILNELNFQDNIEEEGEEEEDEGEEDEDEDKYPFSIYNLDKVLEFSLLDSSLFSNFINSKTFKNLYILVNLLFNLIKEHEIDKEIYITQEEGEKIEEKVKKDFIEELKRDRLKNYKDEKDATMDANLLLLNNKFVISEFKKNRKEKIKQFIKKKRLNHVEDIIYYSYLFKLFYFCIFSRHYNIRYKLFIKILPQNFNVIKFDNLIQKCTQTQNFFLKLQQFFVQYGINNINIYIKRYKERKNFIFERIYKINKRYIHLLWKIFENNYPKVYEKIRNINQDKNSKAWDFKDYFLKLVNNIKEYLNDNKKILNRFESLLFLFLMKIYFENIYGIKNWSNDYLHLNLDDNNLERKESNTLYPIIIRQYPNCYGCLYGDTNYFGNIIYVFFKYKEIFMNNFDGEIKTLVDSNKLIKLNNLLIFKKNKV